MSLHFLHQLGIDVQAAGRIDDQHVVNAAPRLDQCGRGNGARLRAGCHREEVSADLGRPAAAAAARPQDDGCRC